MPPTPKTSVIPPGGFHYIETHGNATVRIESTSVEALAEAILKYRLSNGIPAGNPQQDVNDFICKQWPHFCSDTNEQYLVPNRPPPREEHLSRRASNWMVSLWNLGSANETDPKTAEDRAAICAACPLNQDYHPGACAPCVESLDRLSFIWRRNRTTSVDGALFACKACGQLNAAAVQAAALPPLSPEDIAALATPCWRK